MISEAKIRTALGTLSWNGIFDELVKHSKASDLDALLQLLIRSNHLFYKYPNPKRESIRDEFFVRIESHFKENYDLEFLQKLREVFSILKRTEIVYRNLLAFLKKLPARKRSPDIQCSAALELAVRRFSFIDSRALDSIAKSKKVVLSDEIEGVLDDGSKFSVDSATAGFVENLGTTLTMFAFENEWITDDGTIILPAPIECTDEEIGESAATEFLATSWRRWERVEQGRRYWGGEFLDIEGGKENSNLPPGGRVYLEYIPNEEDRFDWIANERFKEYILQNFGELRFETFANKRVSGIANQVKLLPDEFVNLNEINSAALLSSIMGIDVRDDFTKYSGLRIVEWLRGYCTLSEIAGERAKRERSTKGHILKFEPGELEEQLMKVGLPSETAKAFIFQTSFSSRSVDLFDCPLFRISDESILLFSPAVMHADAGVVTYSNLSSLGETFEKKGKRFENTVLEFFKDNGFNPYSINSSRGGEPYEIDVIVPWEQYLFVFECKNKGLSNNHPIRSYYFRKERDGFIQQIQRQIWGLLQYPDMSLQAGGIDPKDKIIVPCVLYELPYSETGSVDGVYITDWSSLSRFFKDKYIRSKRPYDLFEKDRLLHRTAVYSFWAGEKPTPDDLLRQLSDPVQIRIIRSRLTEIESLFFIDESRFGLTSEYHRKTQTLYELARVLGFDAQVAIREDGRVKKMVAALNQKFERKRLTKQIRAFREKQKRGPH
jgi:hypothetical protein